MKVEGNKALADSKYEEALRLYTEALSLDSNAVLYSNRSAAHTKAGNYIKALGDAEQTIEMRPDWIKVWCFSFILLKGSFIINSLVFVNV